MAEGIAKCSKVVKSSSRKTPMKPWVTPGLLCSINNKNRLYRKSLLSSGIENEIKYKKYRNMLTNILRDSKRAYHQKCFEEKQNDSRGTWKLLSEVIHKHKIIDNELPPHSEMMKESNM